MSLELAWEIFLWIAVSLGILFLLVIVAVILAAVWVATVKFIREFQNSAKVLAQEEQQKREEEAGTYYKGPDDYLQP